MLELEALGKVICFEAALLPLVSGQLTVFRHACVRITVKKPGTRSYGTGALILGPNSLKLISNRHVLHQATRVEFQVMVLQSSDIYRWTCTIDSNAIELHPSNPRLDLAAVDLGRGTWAPMDPSALEDFCVISTGHLLTYDRFYDTNVGLDVFMIGFPNRLDTSNGLPFVRRGILSSHPLEDVSVRIVVGDLTIEDHSVGAVDIACFTGSSGSPVIIRDLSMQKSYSVPPANINHEELSVLGLLFGGPVNHNGRFVSEVVPTFDVDDEQDDDDNSVATLGKSGDDWKKRQEARRRDADKSPAESSGDLSERTESRSRGEASTSSAERPRALPAVPPPAAAQRPIGVTMHLGYFAKSYEILPFFGLPVQVRPIHADVDKVTFQQPASS